MELLAPAGNFDCLKAAVKSGADAVYFAGKGFGARSYAGNFDDEEIYSAVDYCHLRGVQAYATVNTLVFDREFRELENLIKTLTRAGVDGVIVQDLGVLKFIREMSPDISLHASTQMTVHSKDAVKELEKLGVERVVLSRELSGAEIRDIINSTSAEAEVFVHGAMCMSYSGQCLMSSVIGGRSGNRGKCAQPCRLPYSKNGDNAKYYLSLKDMSLADHIKELSDMGVAALKIEGRMKGEAYVSAVVSAYRRFIDENRKPTPDEKEKLNRIFFRGGLTDGYYKNETGKSMFAFDKPDNPYLKNKDEVIDLKEKQLPIEIKAGFKEGEKPYVAINCGGYSAKAVGDFIIETASKKPTLRENIEAQLVKTGGTAFRADKISTEVSDAPFVPISAVNELRRNAILKLEENILARYKSNGILKASYPKAEKIDRDVFYTCYVMSFEQYRQAAGYDFKRIYVPLHIIENNKDELATDTQRVVITLPAIIRGGQRDNVRDRLLKLKELGFDKVEIATIDALSLADGFEVYASQRLNITNSYSHSEAERLGIKGICLSPELNLAQMRDINKSSETEIIGYGRIPIMLSENCMLKNMDMCKCNGFGEISDRTGAKFPVVRDGDICRSVVLNSVPLYMGDKLSDIKRLGAGIRLLFTTEDAEFVKNICENYIFEKAFKTEKFTRLHFYKSALE